MGGLARRGTTGIQLSRECGLALRHSEPVAAISRGPPDHIESYRLRGSCLGLEVD